MNIQELETKSEELRQSGKREECLKIKTQIEELKQKELLSRHNEELERVKKKFNGYIEELHTSVKEIKDGCGTQRGWISIYLDGYKDSLSPQELRRKIRESKEEKESRKRFDEIKTTDRMKSVVIGEGYTETIIDLLRVMELDRVPIIEDMFECGDYHESYEYAYKQAVEDGYSDAEAEQKAMDAESEAVREENDKYINAVQKTINYLFKLHGLHLEVNKGMYVITLVDKSWKEVCQKVAETISGYGTFYYEDAKALKEVGPYTSYSQAVFNHLHWLKHCPEVFGNIGYGTIYENNIR